MPCNAAAGTKWLKKYLGAELEHFIEVHEAAQRVFVGEVVVVGQLWGRRLAHIWSLTTIWRRVRSRAVYSAPVASSIYVWPFLFNSYQGLMTAGY